MRGQGRIFKGRDLNDDEKELIQSEQLKSKERWDYELS